MLTLGDYTSGPVVAGSRGGQSEPVPFVDGFVMMVQLQEDRILKIIGVDEKGSPIHDYVRSLAGQECAPSNPNLQVARSEVRSKYFLEAVTGLETKEVLDGIIGSNIDSILGAVEQGVSAYFQTKVLSGEFSQLPVKKVAETLKNLKVWLMEPSIDEYSKRGILKAVGKERWKDINTAFEKPVKFGTAGVRSLAAIGEEDLREFNEKGFKAEILKGPFTINPIKLALVTAQVAKSFLKQGKSKVTLTYDSRIYGKALADFVAAIFLKFGLTIYLFDSSIPMPGMSYAAASAGLDLGILISASHNASEYNGYKVSNFMGAQLDPVTRNAVLREEVTFDEVRDVLEAAAALEDSHAIYSIPEGSDELGPLVEKYSAGHPERVVILGDKNIATDSRGRRHIDILNPWADHIVGHILAPDMVRAWAPKLKLGYSPFYGNGLASFMRVAVDRLGLLKEKVTVVDEYARMDGFFPRFRYRVVQVMDAVTRALKQVTDAIIPDPGNSAGQAFAWELVMEDIIKQHGGMWWPRWGKWMPF